MHRPRRMTLALALLALASPACGGSTKSASSNDSRYCQLARTMAAPPAGIDPATATPEELTAAVKAHFADHLDDIDELERVAPASVRPDVAVYAATARHIAVTGDLDEFDTPQNASAISRQEGFDKKTCGIEPPGGE